MKFAAVTYAVLGALALLVVLAAPPGQYRHLLAVNPVAATALPFVQGLLVLALLAQVVIVWRREPSIAGWVLTLTASTLVLASVAAALWPLSGSLLDGIGIALVVALSAVVLGAATTGMLLGHWYLVTPALTNRPLLRAIGVLLIGLVLQAVLFPLTLASLGRGAGSVRLVLGLSPVLSILWGLGSVLLPIVTASLALATCRLRSFMSTTGLLYLAMIVILPGQLLGHLLVFVAASA